MFQKTLLIKMGYFANYVKSHFLFEIINLTLQSYIFCSKVSHSISKWITVKLWIEARQIVLTTGLYLGPSIYVEPGFYQIIPKLLLLHTMS